MPVCHFRFNCASILLGSQWNKQTVSFRGSSLAFFWKSGSRIQILRASRLNSVCYWGDWVWISVWNGLIRPRSQAQFPPAFFSFVNRHFQQVVPCTNIKASAHPFSTTYPPFGEWESTVLGCRQTLTSRICKFTNSQAHGLWWTKHSRVRSVGWSAAHWWRDNQASYWNSFSQGSSTN